MSFISSSALNSASSCFMVFPFGCELRNLHANPTGNATISATRRDKPQHIDRGVTPPIFSVGRKAIVDWCAGAAGVLFTQHA